MHPLVAAPVAPGLRFPAAATRQHALLVLPGAPPAAWELRALDSRQRRRSTAPFWRRQVADRAPIPGSGGRIWAWVVVQRELRRPRTPFGQGWVGFECTAGAAVAVVAGPAQAVPLDGTIDSVLSTRFWGAEHPAPLGGARGGVPSIPGSGDAAQPPFGGGRSPLGSDSRQRRENLGVGGGAARAAPPQNTLLGRVGLASSALREQLWQLWLVQHRPFPWTGL